ncbi:MAG: type II toxin-antitoxin system RelE/ParE family toxin [Clostridia bacterium]|nr:type II toxin-antitoxin system RelE/ParE family toxin [Clostridia bacterium]
MERKVKINPIAINDIKEIKEYIKEENTSAITHSIKRITDSIENLAQFPELSMDLSKKIALKTNYRYLIVDEYIIFYKLNSEYLFVYRVLSGKRDYMKILFE